MNMNILCKFILFATISAIVLGDTDNVEIVNVTCDYGEDYEERFSCTISDVDYTSKNRSNFNILNADSSKDVVQLRMVTGHYDVLPLNLFKVFPKLEGLEINTGLKAITKENLIGGGNQLKRLRLAENDIAVIDAHTFDGMEKLDVIYLERNKLVNIESSAFTGAINLKILDLSSNQIETIEDGAFNIKTLIEIDLSGNKFKTLKDDVFVGAAELMNIYLFSNELTQIGKSIENVPKLSMVSFYNRNVKITDFDFHAIARKPYLVDFQSSGVRLTLDDPVSAANDNYKTEHLDITRNNLAYPDILNRLRNFQNLVSLNIGHNDFATINDIENIKEIFPKLERLVFFEIPCKDEIVERLQKKFGSGVRLDSSAIYFN